ncbi:MAG TPA: SurA N-terminal domain-containing protein, partial [Anaerolineales bacterium]
MPNERGDRPVVHTKKHVARLERERQQTRLILYSFIGILVLVVGLLAYGYIDEKYLQLNRPVARIGEVEISTRDFQTRVKLQRNQLIGTYDQYYQLGQAFGMDVSSQLQQIQAQLDTPAQLGQSVLDQVINEELILQESHKRGLTVSADEIETAIRS